MKKVLMTALSGGVLLGCLLGAAPAHADPALAQYERDLRAAGFTNDGGDGAQLSLGQGFCARMDAGESSSSLVRELYRNSDVSQDEAQKFVDITIRDLCPWNH